MQYKVTSVSFFKQGGLGEAASSILGLIRQSEGLVGFRDFYRALLRLPAAGGSLYQAILNVELKQTDDCLSDGKIRAMFEVKFSMCSATQLVALAT